MVASVICCVVVVYRVVMLVIITVFMEWLRGQGVQVHQIRVGWSLVADLTGMMCL